MIDPAWCDDRVINVLRAQINVIEQLCSAPVGSIVDFTENGDPVHSDNSRLARQLESIVPMQERCVEFARDAEAWFAAGGTRPSEEALALSSAAVLAQQGFFPSAGQLEALEGFQHDYNVGTDEVFSIFDPRRGLAQLRRGGLASVMNQDRGGPLERRAAGLEVAMPGVSLLRFGSFAAGNDGPVRAERLPVIALSAGGQRQEQLTAPATHDGFFLLQMNLTPGTTLAVNLGRAYRWLQIESIEACCGEKPGAPGEPATRVDLLAQTRMDNLLSRGEDIYQCMSEQALLIAPPPPPPRSDGRWTLRILFRPLERREAAPRPLAAIA